MIQNRIEQIEAKIRGAQNVPEDVKGELLNLLATLRSETGDLANTHPEDAQSIAQFADASAHEVTRSERKPELLNAALQGLTSSADGLEASHPRIVEAVNRMALILSNMGI
jgi:hypothetical protein